MKQVLEVVKEAEQADKEERQKMLTIAGGVHITVYHLDGSQEQVKVRQIPATKLEAFMNKLADEATSVSIYCDKPTEWVDSLEHKSITEICDKGLEINESFLNAWCRRRAKWTEMMNVGLIADLQKRLETVNDLLVSVASAQKLPIAIDSVPKK